MRNLILTILALLLAMPAHAAELLLIVQSHNSQVLNQTVRQIQNQCGSRNQTYIMGNYAEFDLARIVREEMPRAVVAVGDKPLKEAMKLRTTPVIYTLALSADESRLRDNVTGVTVHVSPDKYLKLFRKLGLRRPGVVYSRAKSGAYIDRVKKLAPGYGVELVGIEINSPSSSDAALTALKKEGIDSLWMIADTTAVTAESLNSFFLHAQRANIPLISFSRAYLGKGALAVLEASSSSMSDQLCKNLAQILNGTTPAKIPVTDVAEASIYTNESVAANLGISTKGLDKLFGSDR